VSSVFFASALLPAFFGVLFLRVACFFFFRPSYGRLVWLFYHVQGFDLRVPRILESFPPVIASFLLVVFHPGPAVPFPSQAEPAPYQLSAFVPAFTSTAFLLVSGTENQPPLALCRTIPIPCLPRVLATKFSGPSLLLSPFPNVFSTYDISVRVTFVACSPACRRSVLPQFPTFSFPRFYFF